MKKNTDNVETGKTNVEEQARMIAHQITTFASEQGHRLSENDFAILEAASKILFSISKGS